MPHTPDAPLLLVAAGGLARETAVAARAAGWSVLGCLDDDPALFGREVAPGLPVLGAVDEVTGYPDAALVICAGKGASRRRIAGRLAFRGAGDERFATIVHPTAVLPGRRDSTTLGAGSVLLAGTVLTADVTLGRHVVSMPHAVLTHDCTVEDFGTLCAGVVLGGAVAVGSEAYLGMACSVRQGVRIGRGATIGMGAAVVGDVPDGEIWVGVPARRLVASADHRG